MANIMDLLADYKRTVKINDNISFLYITYQVCRRFLINSYISIVTGPGFRDEQ
jgi:hypothetical protein